MKKKFFFRLGKSKEKKNFSGSLKGNGGDGWGWERYEDEWNEIQEKSFTHTNHVTKVFKLKKRIKIK